MIQEAWLFTKEGFPIWHYSMKPIHYDENLLGTLISALTLFSSEISGEKIKSIEMGNSKFFVFTFGGLITLAIFGNSNKIDSPLLYKIIDSIQEAIDLLKSTSEIDQSLLDEENLRFYLSNQIFMMENWMNNSISNSKPSELIEANLFEVTSKLSALNLNKKKINLGIILLKNEKTFSNILYDDSDMKSDIQDLVSLYSQIFRDKNNISLLPQIVESRKYCLGFKELKSGSLLIVFCKWDGTVGNSVTINQIKSWTNLIAKQL